MDVDELILSGFKDPRVWAQAAIMVILAWAILTLTLA